MKCMVGPPERSRFAVHARFPWVIKGLRKHQHRSCRRFEFGGDSVWRKILSQNFGGSAIRNGDTLFCLQRKVNHLPGIEFGAHHFLECLLGGGELRSLSGRQQWHPALSWLPIKEVADRGDLTHADKIRKALPDAVRSGGQPEPHVSFFRKVEGIKTVNLRNAL